MKKGKNKGRLFCRGTKGDPPPKKHNMFISIRCQYHLLTMGSTQEAWGYRDYVHDVATKAHEMLRTMKLKLAENAEAHSELTEAGKDLQGE